MPQPHPPWFLLLTGLLTGCATTPHDVAPDAAAPSSSCRAFLDHFDRMTAVHRVQDAQATPVPGFPYLRANRLLASLGGDRPDGERFAAWVEALRQEDLQARQTEWRNLPPLAQRELTALSPQGPPLEAAANCGGELSRQETPAQRERLFERVAVPDDYQAWKRLLGLYWLSAWPIKWGVERWHHETHTVYQTPLEQLPVHGRLVRYAPPERDEKVTPAQVREILRRTSANPLQRPLPAGEDRERLFAAFAPTWQVDTASYDDLIGAPEWPAQGSTAVIATAHPTVYRHLSHTRFQGELLPQLNYTVWFPSRPFVEGQRDLLGGHLDGITWRVTLTREGEPLVYDTIHNCGCYHLFFPSPGLRVRKVNAMLQEPAFAPQAAPAAKPGEGLTLRISHTAHFIDRVTSQPVPQGESRPYRWADYDDLRSLAVADGSRHSLFGEDGIVPGTERGERWLFWTMGVPNPGEMRQWGHHATAFFGRRHFDDPFLMETSFERKP